MSSDHSPPSRDKSESPPPKKTKQSHLTSYLHNLCQWQSLPTFTSSTKARQPLSHYIDDWEVLYNSNAIRDENSQWCAFWHEWWGANSPGKTRLELAAREDPLKPTSSHRILNVAQDAVWRTLRTLEDSEGSILLREEFTSLYDRLSPPFEGYCPGVLVKGQPGIGKSYFLVYALLRRMGEGEPVLFSTSAGSTLLFDQHGIRYMRTDQVHWEHLPPDDPYVLTSRTWSLIDASVSSEAEDSMLVHPKVFVVCASPPRVPEHKNWIQREYPPQFIMEPWCVWELDWLLSVDGLTPLSQDQRAQYCRQRKNVEQLVQEVGPCPRDIFSYMSSPNEYEARIRSALEGVRGVQDIRDLFANADRDMTSRQAQELVLLRRAWSTGPTDMDWPLVCFKSRDIGLRVMRRVGYLGVEDAVELFEKNRRWPQSRALAQWVFESLVIGVISGSGTSLNCVSDTMLRTQPSDQDALPPRPTKSRRVVPACEDISCLALDEDLCYSPLRRDNPVFDAFFVELTNDTVVVRLFKVAIPRNCVDSHDDAFDMLAALLEKAKTHFGKPKARPEYVLFAPYTRRPNQSASATWDVPTRERWSEFKGDVHVYYIDPVSLGCEVHDLLECLPDYADSEPA